MVKSELITIACNLLRLSIKNGQPFYTNYPFTDNELDEALYATAKEKNLYSSELFIHTIACENTLDKEMISAYWKALRWGFMRVETRITFGTLFNHPFPYYFASGDTLIVYNTNGGYITHTENIGEYIAINSDNCFRMVSVVHEGTALLTNEAMLKGKTLHSLENSLCPNGLYDYNMLANAFSENIPSNTKDYLIKSYLQYYDLSARYDEINIYTLYDAVLDRLKTGREYSVSKKYLDEFSPEARMKQIRRLSDNDNVKLIKKDSKIKLPFCYEIDMFDSSLHTHFKFTDKDAQDYELYAVYPFTKVRGLKQFLDNIFVYLDLDYNRYSDSDKKMMLNQEILLYNSTVN